MNHTDIQKHLADYLEGDLELGDRALVDAHLDSCDSCSAEVEEMLQTIRLLRTLPEPEIPPLIAANVMRRIRAGETQAGFWTRMWRGLGSMLEPTFVLPASAIAVAALVVTVTQSTLIAGFVAPEVSTQVVLSESNGRQTASVGRLAAERDGAAFLESASGNTARSMAGALSSLVPDLGRSGTAVGEADASSRRPTVVVADSSGAIPRTIRLRIDGSGVARLSTSGRYRLPQPVQPSRSLNSADGLRFTSVVPEAWATQFSRVLYADQENLASARSFAAEVSPRFTEGLIQPVALARTVAEESGLSDFESGDADPRDAWLALGFEDPKEFARYISAQNLAEQELWTARLSQRAEARGVLHEFLRVLRGAGDATAIWVADDFEAQVNARSDDASSSEADASSLR